MGKNKALAHRTSTRIFIHVVCRFNSVAFVAQLLLLLLLDLATVVMLVRGSTSPPFVWIDSGVCYIRYRIYVSILYGLWTRALNKTAVYACSALCVFFTFN